MTTTREQDKKMGRVWGQHFGDLLHGEDTPIRRTLAGDYVVFHGTSVANLARMRSQKTLRGDALFGFGFTTHPQDTVVYALLKGGARGWRTLRIVLAKDWFEAQRIQREVGGPGRNAFLIKTRTIPRWAIKSVKVVGGGRWHR